MNIWCSDTTHSSLSSKIKKWTSWDDFIQPLTDRRRKKTEYKAGEDNSGQPAVSTKTPASPRIWQQLWNKTWNNRVKLSLHDWQRSQTKTLEGRRGGGEGEVQRRGGVDEILMWRSTCYNSDLYRDISLVLVLGGGWRRQRAGQVGRREEAEMIFAASTAPVTQQTEGSASSPWETGLFFPPSSEYVWKLGSDMEACGGDEAGGVQLLHRKRDTSPFCFHDFRHLVFIWMPFCQLIKTNPKLTDRNDPSFVHFHVSSLLEGRELRRSTLSQATFKKKKKLFV